MSDGEHKEARKSHITDLKLERLPFIEINIVTCWEVVQMKGIVFLSNRVFFVLETEPPLRAESPHLQAGSIKRSTAAVASKIHQTVIKEEKTNPEDELILHTPHLRCPGMS